MQLKYKITLTIMLISLMTLAIVSFLYSKKSYEDTINYEQKVLSTNAIDAARYIELQLLDKLSNAKTMASAPVLLQALKKSNEESTKLGENLTSHINYLNNIWMSKNSIEDKFVKPYLNNNLALYLKEQQKILQGVYGELFVTNRYGEMIATTGKLTTLYHANKYWFKEAYSNGEGKIFFDDRGFDTSVNGYVIGIVLPIKSDGKIIGVLKANVNIISTLHIAAQHHLDMQHGVLKVVRTKGKIVYEQGFPPLSTNINPNIITALVKNETGTTLTKEHTKEVLMAYAPIKLSLNNKDILFGGKIKTKDHNKGNDGEIWHAVVTYDKQLALADSRKTNKLIIYIGLILTFLTAIVAYIIARWISKPIEELQIAQEKLKAQEEIMIAQSRHAAMGEMISMIAHQWRQPISAISMEANNILADIELDTLDDATLKESSLGIIKQTKELSSTIDDFRNFFKPSKEIDEISVESPLEDALEIIHASLEKSGIKISLTVEKNRKIQTYSRELMQVFLNILKNSKEAFPDDTESKYINISIISDLDNVKINICDNAGGIKEDIMKKIFNPYFSTKTKKNGTGLGLYMSKTIINQHLQGTITAYNKDNGTCFEIILPHKIKEFES